MSRVKMVVKINLIRKLASMEVMRMNTCKDSGKDIPGQYGSCEIRISDLPSAR